MNSAFKVIEGRDVSSFPLSVGTGLAISTIFEPIMEVIDPERKQPKMVDKRDYDGFIVNVETLVRNIISSIPRDEMRYYRSGDFLATLVDEITFLTQFFQANGLTIEFYINTYHYFKTNYPDNLREFTTEKQMKEIEITSFCLKHIRGEFSNIHLFTNRIRFTTIKSGLLLSHIPADLLSYVNFALLDLLESHTGLVKRRRDYASKYFAVPREDMLRLPFFESALLIFGDKTMFRPKGINERKAYYQFLISEKLTPLTTYVIAEQRSAKFRFPDK